MTEDKSCGQKSVALLERIYAVLKGQEVPLFGLKADDWLYGTAKRDPKSPGQWVGEDEYKAEVLKERYLGEGQGRAIVLMDEPERSLDGRAEMSLWKLIEAADCSKVQVIVATHSVYPAMHPERFNIIESEKGYLESVRELLQS